MLLLVALSIGIAGMVGKEMHGEWVVVVRGGAAAGHTGSANRRHWHYCFSAARSREAPDQGTLYAFVTRDPRLDLDPVAGLASPGWLAGRVGSRVHGFTRSALAYAAHDTTSPSGARLARPAVLSRTS